MTESGTMSRWTCEQCGHRNKPMYGNCEKCLRGFDEDFMEPNHFPSLPNDSAGISPNQGSTK